MKYITLHSSGLLHGVLNECQKAWTTAKLTLTSCIWLSFSFLLFKKKCWTIIKCLKQNVINIPLTEWKSVLALWQTLVQHPKRKRKQRRWFMLSSTETIPLIVSTGLVNIWGSKSMQPITCSCCVALVFHTLQILVSYMQHPITPPTEVKVKDIPRTHLVKFGTIAKDQAHVGHKLCSALVMQRMFSL